MNSQQNKEPYILVADDDPLMLKSLRIILRATGYKIVTVLNGQDAWDRMNLQKPLLAFLDVMMGQVNGLELVKKIRASAELKDLTVFLLTARAMPNERQQGLDAGADDYITKPFCNSDLLQRVQKVLATRAPHIGD